jgi:DNA invertase Pin-like site-specific DNA recombinase
MHNVQADEYYMLGVFAEFENNLQRERQMAGINTAKARASKRAASRA